MRRWRSQGNNNGHITNTREVRDERTNESSPHTERLTHWLTRRTCLQHGEREGEQGQKGKGSPGEREREQSQRARRALDRSAQRWSSSVIGRKLHALEYSAATTRRDSERVKQNDSDRAPATPPFLRLRVFRSLGWLVGALSLLPASVARCSAAYDGHTALGECQLERSRGQHRP